jgi:ubiquitin-conjugating enzyme E2 Q
MRAAIVQQLNTLPSVSDMKKHLERKVKPGKSKPKLKDMDAKILPAAWSIVRWCVGSCTAYLEEVTGGADRIQNLGMTIFLRLFVPFFPSFFSSSLSSS